MDIYRVPHNAVYKRHDFDSKCRKTAHKNKHAVKLDSVEPIPRFDDPRINTCRVFIDLLYPRFPAL
jgi:hypothetical protein